MGESVQTPQERPSIGRWIGIGLCVVAVIVGGVYAAKWLSFRLSHVTTDAAYVKVDMVSVAPQVPGKILKVAVRDGERVTAGQVLIEIDDTEIGHQQEQSQAAIAGADGQVKLREATLVHTRASVNAAQAAAVAGLEAARATLVKAQAGLGYLESQERRMAALLEQQAVPKARWDETHAAAEAARADVQAARQGIAVAEARVAEAQAARNGVAEAAAALESVKAGATQARAALAELAVVRGRAVVRAPIDGVVGRVFVRAGDFAVPGRAVVALYDPHTRYVEARFEETRIQGLRPGTEADLEIDALPGVAMKGTIRRIVPAAAQEFALIPRDVTAGEFTKVIQRVAVEIDVPAFADHAEIVPGLSVTVACPKGGR
jgi:membrane fusion protein (multidrug efflux system)